MLYFTHSSLLLVIHSLFHSFIHFFFIQFIAVWIACFNSLNDYAIILLFHFLSIPSFFFFFPLLYFVYCTINYSFILFYQLFICLFPCLFSLSFCYFSILLLIYSFSYMFFFFFYLVRIWVSTQQICLLFKFSKSQICQDRLLISQNQNLFPW